MIFHETAARGEGLYITQLRITLAGPLRRSSLRRAWQMAIARHDILRTHFEWRHGGEALQVVHRSVPLPYAEHLWGTDNGEYEDRLSQWLARDLAQGFDPAEAPLTRVNLFARAGGEHDLVWTCHHSLLDGWSTARILTEVMTAYNSDRFEIGDTAQFRDYVSWLQIRPSGEEWWTHRFSTVSDSLGTSLGLRRPRHLQIANELRSLVLPRDLSDALRTAARNHEVTLSTLMQGAWAILLARYSGSSAVSFGVTVSGRPPELPGVEDMVGLFINSLPFIVNVNGSVGLAEWLATFQAHSVELRQYEHTALTDLQTWLRRPVSSLFDTLFVFENYPLDEALSDTKGDVTIEAVASVERTHYPLAVSVVPSDEIKLRWSARSEHIDAATLESVTSDYMWLLSRLATADATTKLGQLANALGARHQPVSDHPFRAVVPRIAEQAALRPDAEALSCEGERISYGELEAWSNRVGRRLKRLGIAPEERVGLAVERSTGLVAGLLGILKAGGAYVPLDPSYPADRLRHMIEDSGLTKVVTDAASAEVLGDLLTGLDVVLVTDVDAESAEGWEEPVHADQLAYVIYTSGSTGMPKGVGVSHQALSLHIDDYIETFGYSDADTVLQFATINFDVATEQLLPVLSVGGRVLMRGPQIWDMPTLNEQLAEHRVTIMNPPTAYWREWLDALPDDLPALRLVAPGGEALAGDALKRWQEGSLSKVPLHNFYGPTETTVTALHRETVTEDAGEAIVPIGVPYPSRSAFVMDRDGNEAPVGGLGELCIGGETLARGYVGKPGLTAERFVPDPTRPGGRLYRSGDLVRQRPDGVVDFLGRLDNQVKLRGFRIELGEIEAALRAAPGVRDAVAVIAGEGEHKHILAYAAGEADPDDLRSRLEQALPGYMVPASVMVLDALPLMPNGKIDRKALPEPDGQAERTIVAPRNETEARLLAVWKAVLKRDDIGVTDNFFMLGGDSLLCLQVAARARSQRILLPVRQVFLTPTVADLVANIGQSGQLVTDETLQEMTTLLEELDNA
ncbi:amino acid adenylation domain-containing protein [Agrobacterium tumefaciens]|uniref:amino acid adenylation domain-containing protein n=1 Tax=Agrobacterium tumefaciens TaxID=358 RepID=UPI0024C10DE5|nr:amino acid adenylation domain-containing protein [Agrobacterium tumefaciens]